MHDRYPLSINNSTVSIEVLSKQKLYRNPLRTNLGQHRKTKRVELTQLFKVHNINLFCYGY